MNSTFTPENMEKNIDNEIVNQLENIALFFKAHMRNQSKKYGLSSIQLEILIYILNHPEEIVTISSIADKFKRTKASISDSVKALENKSYIFRKKNINDYRILAIELTEDGRDIANNSSKFSSYIEKAVAKIEKQKKQLFLDVLKIINDKLFLKILVPILIISDFISDILIGST